MPDMTTNCPTCGESLENLCDCNIQTRGGGALPRTVAEIASLTARSRPNQSSPSAADALREWIAKDCPLGVDPFYTYRDAVFLAGHTSRDGEVAGLTHELEHVWKPATAMNEQYARAYQQERDCLRAEVETLRKERDETKQSTEWFMVWARHKARTVLEFAKGHDCDFRRACESFMHKTKGLEDRQTELENIRAERDALTAQLAEAKAEAVNSESAIRDQNWTIQNIEAALSAAQKGPVEVAMRLVNEINILTSAQTLAGELAGALEFIRDECEWEEGGGHGGFTAGDNRIGPACTAALTRYRAQQRPTGKEAE